MGVADATARAGLPPFAGTIIQEVVDNMNLEDSSNQPQGFVMIRRGWNVWSTIIGFDLLVGEDYSWCEIIEQEANWS